MTMFSFMIAFEPPDSQQFTDKWEKYFKESILPELKDDFEWSQEEFGWGNLEGKDHKRVCKVMETNGWERGVTWWGSLRFDPVQQEPPHQEPVGGGC
jgi:hypothetical protein